METFKSVISNPTVFAALLTAGALIIQNIISGRRESKREVERQEHLERMAELAQVSERELRLESNRRERSASRAKDLADACLEMISVFKERNLRQIMAKSSQSKDDPLYLENLTALLGLASTAGIAVTKVELLNTELGAMCKDLSKLQYGVMVADEELLPLGKPNEKLQQFTNELAKLTARAHSIIYSLQEDDGLLVEGRTKLRRAVNVR